jgi:hypothetical protein
MDIGEVIFTLLKASSDVTDIIGAGDACKAFPIPAAQGSTVPYVTYQRIGGLPNATKLSPSTVDTIRYQVNIIAATQTLLEVLAEKVRLALDGQKGTIAGIVVQEIWFDDDHDDYNNGITPQGAFMRMQDYLIRAQR